MVFGASGPPCHRWTRALRSAARARRPVRRTARAPLTYYMGSTPLEERRSRLRGRCRRPGASQALGSALVSGARDRCAAGRSPDRGPPYASQPMGDGTGERGPGPAAERVRAPAFRSNARAALTIYKESRSLETGSLIVCERYPSGPAESDPRRTAPHTYRRRGKISLGGRCPSWQLTTMPRTGVRAVRSAALAGTSPGVRPTQSGTAETPHRRPGRPRAARAGTLAAVRPFVAGGRRRRRDDAVRTAVAQRNRTTSCVRNGGRFAAARPGRALAASRPGRPGRADRGRAGAARGRGTPGGRSRRPGPPSPRLPRSVLYPE